MKLVPVLFINGFLRLWSWVINSSYQWGAPCLALRCLRCDRFITFSTIFLPKVSHRNQAVLLLFTCGSWLLFNFNFPSSAHFLGHHGLVNVTLNRRDRTNNVDLPEMTKHNDGVNLKIHRGFCSWQYISESSDRSLLQAFPLYFSPLCVNPLCLFHRGDWVHLQNTRLKRRNWLTNNKERESQSK